MTLSRALKEQNLEGWFKRQARPNVRSSVLLERLKAHPRLQCVTVWPKSLASIRENLGCQGMHGGGHGRSRGKAFLIVTPSRRIVQSGLTWRREA
jgi:hypothetical protein